MKIPKITKVLVLNGSVALMLVSSIGCNRAPAGPAVSSGPAATEFQQTANQPAPPSNYDRSRPVSSTQRRYLDRERHPVERLDRETVIQDQENADQAGTRTVVRDRYGNERVVREYSSPVRREVVTNRPFSHSAAIVGGGAAAGAVIGALAGGGKGAAIGALAGGGSGLVYDRLTHKKVRVE